MKISEWKVRLHRQPAGPLRRQSAVGAGVLPFDFFLGQEEGFAQVFVEREHLFERVSDDGEAVVTVDFRAQGLFGVRVAVVFPEEEGSAVLRGEEPFGDALPGAFGDVDEEELPLV